MATFLLSTTQVLLRDDNLTLCMFSFIGSPFGGNNNGGGFPRTCSPLLSSARLNFTLEMCQRIAYLEWMVFLPWLASFSLDGAPLALL